MTPSLEGNLNNKIENNKALLKDLIQGEDKVLKREDFNSLMINEINQAIDLLVLNPDLNEKEKNYLLGNIWRVIYKAKPPTIKEFVNTPVWLGPSQEGIRPWV